MGRGSDWKNHESVHITKLHRDWQCVKGIYLYDL